MQLQKLSMHLPAGAVELLQALGGGETGFGGTAFGRGEASIEQCVADCLAAESWEGTPAGFVPQILFWIIDGHGAAIGLVKIRPKLNDRLLQSGGNVGFYVCRSARRTGVATEALRSAVSILREMGLLRVLVTAGVTNEGSNRVIQRGAGIYDGQGRSAEGELVNRYWIDCS